MEKPALTPVPRLVEDGERGRAERGDDRADAPPQPQLPDDRARRLEQRRGARLAFVLEFLRRNQLPRASVGPALEPEEAAIGDVAVTLGRQRTAPSSAPPGGGLIGPQARRSTAAAQAFSGTAPAGPHRLPGSCQAAGAAS